MDEIQPQAGTATVLVDCGLGTSNHLVTRNHIQPVAVIDHHMNGTRGARLPFKDIRENAAASASIAASYLREQRIEPGPKLASAMLYAIRTETCGNETYHSRLDRSVIIWLTARYDPSLLAEIENAPLSREYYGDLVLAMQGTFLYDDAAFCLLPRASVAEIGGEAVSSGTTITADGDVTFALGGNKITGNGSGLTNLDGSNIASGTVADARIASTIARDSETLDATNSFFTQLKAANTGWTGSNHFGGNTTFALAPLGSGASLTNIYGSNLVSGAWVSGLLGFDGSGNR